MESSNLQTDLLIGQLVRVLGCSKPPFSKEDCEILRKGVDLLEEIEREIVTPRQNTWMKAHFKVTSPIGKLGQQAMQFFGTDELNTKDQICVLRSALNCLPKLHRLIDAKEQEDLLRFFMH